MRTFALLLLLVFAAPAAAATLALPVHYPGDAQRAPCWAGDVLEVQLSPAATRTAHPRGAGPTRAGAMVRVGVPALDAVAAALGATFESEFAGERAPETAGAPDFTSFHLVHLPAGVTLEDALARLRALPEVASAWPLAELPTTWACTPNDSLFAYETWLYHPSVPRHDLHAPEAWCVQQGDTSAVIAILDTGVLPYHPDLGGTIAGGHGNMWVNWAEAGGLPGVDDDGDGFVDDIAGWDFVTGVTGAAGEDVNDPDNDPNDYVGHGTMVAGIAGAIADNGSGIAGVAPHVRLMPVRMGWLANGSVRPTGTVRMDFAAQAIRYATLKGATVINCSWASAYTAGLDSAVSAAVAAGVTVVSASGNYSSANYLATRGDVISVAATDSNDVYWVGSETGPWLDIAAGGTAITTTYIQTAGADSIGSRQPAYVRGMVGTSFAAPQVSAAVALLQSQRRAQGRTPVPPAGVNLWLRQTADDVTAANPGMPDIAPRLNLYRMLTEAGLVAVGGGPQAARAGLALAVRRQPARVPVSLDWSDATGGGSHALAILDVAGRALRRVTLGTERGGSWTWDGRDGESRLLPAGLYFARLACGDRHTEARIVLTP